MPLHRPDPAALLREAFTAREADLGSAARIGRARLTARMAQVPARHANAWVPALSGLAAAALIGGAALLHLREARQVTAPLAPVRTAAIAPAPPSVLAAPEPAVSPEVPTVAPAMLRLTKPQAPSPKPALLAPALSLSSETRDPGPETRNGEVRLAKSSGGILVSWDGPASNRQYELRKTCLDPRTPGAAVVDARIRSNDGQWLDTTPDSCGAGAATLYEVAEVTNV